MPKPLTILHAVLAATAAAGTLSACSAEDDQARPSAPAVTAVPTPRSVADLALPLDAYEPTGEQYARIQKAAAFSMRDCMKRYGFTLRVPAITVPDIPKNAGRLEWRGGQGVEEYGFRGRPGTAARMLLASTRMMTPIVVPAARKDARFAQVVQAWSRCMQQMIGDRGDELEGMSARLKAGLAAAERVLARAE